MQLERFSVFARASPCLPTYLGSDTVPGVPCTPATGGHGADDAKAQREDRAVMRFDWCLGGTTRILCNIKTLH